MGDQQIALTICDELIEMIEDADKKVEGLVFSQTEVAAIQGAIVEQDAIIEKVNDTEREEVSNWRIEIRNALQNLGGEADLSDIYDYISQNTTRELPISWKQIVRWALQVNSADTTSFAGKHNTFKWVAKGRWALRNNEPETVNTTAG